MKNFPPLPADPSIRRRFWSETDLFRPPEAPVSIQRQMQPPTAMHRHGFTEFVLILSGSGIHDVDGERHELAPGDFFVMEGRRAHAYRTSAALELVNVLIRNRTLRRLRPVLTGLDGYARLFGKAGQPFRHPRPLLPGEKEELLQILARMRRELERMAQGCEPMLLALLTEFLITACRLTGAPHTRGVQRSRIGRVVTWLEQHYAEPVTLANLEKIACMSPRTLQRRFQAAMRATPVQHLLRLRIANACRLLRETDMPLKEIAPRCGVPDSAYFSRLFRQYAGATPSDYRRQPLR
jgi:AraC-like DNA-binding protein